MNGLLLLVSYPKSGNTWLRLALQRLARMEQVLDLNEMTGRSKTACARFLLDRTLSIESSDLTAAELEAARPAFHSELARRVRGCVTLKVHDAWTQTANGQPLFPASAIGGVVYLVRDPRDVAPSLAHHCGTSIDEAITEMANPDSVFSASTDLALRQMPQRLLSWSGHVESWLDTSGARVLLLRYEDMVTDMSKALARVTEFAGIEADAAAIDRAVEAVSFSTLRALEEREGFSERPPNIQRFFRRGIVGSWRDELTTAQSESIVRSHSPMMRRLGYHPDSTAS